MAENSQRFRFYDSASYLLPFLHLGRYIRLHNVEVDGGRKPHAADVARQAEAVEEAHKQSAKVQVLARLIWGLSTTRIFSSLTNVCLQVASAASVARLREGKPTQAQRVKFNQMTDELKKRQQATVGEMNLEEHEKEQRERDADHETAHCGSHGFDGELPGNDRNGGGGDDGEGFGGLSDEPGGRCTGRLDESTTIDNGRVPDEVRDDCDFDVGSSISSPAEPQREKIPPPPPPSSSSSTAITCGVTRPRGVRGFEKVRGSSNKHYAPVTQACLACWATSISDFSRCATSELS